MAKKKSYIRYMLNTQPFEFGNQDFFYLYRTKREVMLTKRIQEDRHKWKKVRLTLEEIK